MTNSANHSQQAHYWDQRTQELKKSIALHEQALFRNLRQYYARESAILDREIASYYSKYGTNYIIQYRNLLQSLPDADRQLLYEKIQDFEQKYPQYAHLTPVRESIYKLDRLEGLRTSIAIQQLQMGAYEIAQAREHFQQMALLSGNLIAEQMGYGSSFYRIDSDMLRLVVGQDWCNNQDFSARIWHNRNALTQTLQTQLVNGMIRGDSYKTISKSVQNKFQSVSQRNIERLVFTEDTFLANEAAMQTYLNDPDYAYYEYVSIGDGKTCELCASLTGERFRISERRPGTNFPPLHPWCRCFFDIVYEKNSEKHTERDSENSRNRRQTGLTKKRKNDTIIIASNAHPRNIELENTIKRCIDSNLPIFADDLVRGVSKIKPPHNEYVVGLHGSDRSTWIFGQKIDVKILSNIIKARKDYHGEDIYLFSCNTGNTTNTEDCFAQLLADKMGVTVYAPTEYGVVWSNGRHYSGKLDFTPSGEIKPFKPRKGDFT